VRVLILNKIIAVKKEEVARALELETFEALKEKISTLGLTKSLKEALNQEGQVSLLAEIKKASPSKGVIRADFNPLEIAKIYETNGASAISILTDEQFFQGSLKFLEDVSQIANIPLLRKDFIIHPYQIYQARAYGADAILLIAAVLSKEEIQEYLHLAKELGLECLVEVHTEEELLKVKDLPIEVLGVNNRNLNTFKTDLNTTFVLKEMIKDKNIVLVSESGINHRSDVLRLLENGVKAMLVGEALMRETDIAAKVLDLLGRGK
jgi:indole-3-glycerol phosphate synthase